MKIFGVFSAGILLVALLTVQPLAQSRERVAKAKNSSTTNPCPNRNGRQIWIKISNEADWLDGVFLEFDDDYVYYCEGRRVESAEMKKVQAIHFDSKPTAANSSLQKPTGVGPSALKSPDGVTPIKASIKSPLRFRHKTLSGIVKLRVELKEDTSVGTVTHLEGGDAVLIELAKTAAKGLEFVPEVRGGKFVTTEEDLVFTFFAETPKNLAKKAALPEPISPSGAKKIPPEKTQLVWKSVPGAVAYKLKIAYSYDDVNWEQYRDKSLSAEHTSYELPYLGKVTVKWLVEVECEDGTETEGWWAFFSYAKR